MQRTPTAGPDLRNLVMAIALATSVMLAWQYFYERPRMAQKIQQEQIEAAKKVEAPRAESPKPEAKTQTVASPRIRINSGALHGSIALAGARFDDLTLAEYRESAAPDSEEVKLLNPANDLRAYFAEVGVLPGDTSVKVPDATTLWHSSARELTPEQPVTLSWSNGEGLTFEKTIAVDTHYMFTITTSVKNTGVAPVTLYPYGLLSRNWDDTTNHFSVGHEGPLGVMNQVLDDVSYKSLREDGAQKFEKSQGWIGITDKYWLTALIPETSETFDAEYKHFTRDSRDAYQSDLRGEALKVPAGESASFAVHLFAGPKVVGQLDAYSTQYNIPLFDRAVDFGRLYFLTKPIFTLLNYFHGLVGNAGIAILLLTVCIKLLLFPLAHKSMVAMARTKQLAPKMTEIKEKYSTDKMKMNQEMMALYKREKVNPVGGCLPLVLQIPIFLSLYRVLSVTIEMRQAPFFGWIHDLSVADPTNLFTLFGLVPWVPPHALHLGIWPLIMCATMVLQQRLNPKPTDPVQAQVIAYMPFMLLFMFSGLPAGVVIYYAWNNTLTILQQLYINTHLTKKGLR